jgi:uncharacterized SAM-dependent methyltransferase
MVHTAVQIGIAELAAMLPPVAGTTRAELEDEVAAVVPPQDVSKLLADLKQLQPDETGIVRWFPPTGLKYCAGGTALWRLAKPYNDYLKVREMRLAEEKAALILDVNKTAHHWVLDLGSGSGWMCKGIVAEALRLCESVTYTPLDTALEAVNTAKEMYASELPAAKLLPHVGSWDDAMQTSFYKDLPQDTEITATFMGTTAGNFSDDYMVSFIDGFLSTWDQLPFRAKLVLWVDGAPSDLKPAQAIVDAYGCAEDGALDFHMMKMINASLDLDFPLDKLQWNVDYDTREEAIKMWMEAVDNFPVNHHGQQVTQIPKGSRIQTQMSRKFSDALLQSMAERAGANLVIHRTDDDFYKAAVFSREATAKRT